MFNCLAGYKLCDPPLISHLTPAQQYFITLVTQWDIETKIKLAGGEVDNSRMNKALEDESDRIQKFERKYKDRYDEIIAAASKPIPPDYDPAKAPIFNF